MCHEDPKRCNCYFCLLDGLRMPAKSEKKLGATNWYEKEQEKVAYQIDRDMAIEKARTKTFAKHFKEDSEQASLTQYDVIKKIFGNK